MLNITWLRRLAWATVALLTLWGVSWLALPPLLKSQAERHGSEALGRTLTIGAVDFKPWTLELSVSDIRVASADGKSTQLSIARLYADAEVQSLWRLAPVIDAITIDQPHLALTHQGDGHYDIDDVLQRLASDPKAPDSAPLRFALYNLVLNQGAADFTDQTAGAERVHHLSQLQLALPFLSSFDSQREVTVQPHLAFDLNGSRFDSSAQATPFAATRKGEVSLQVTHLDFAPYLPYLPASLPVRLQGAVLDSALKLTFEQGATNRLLVSGAVKLSDIRINDRAGAAWLSVASVETVLKDVRPLEQTVALESLDIQQPSLSIRRNRAGKWLLPTAPAAATAAGTPTEKPVPAASAPGWKLAIAHAQMQGGQVRLVDESVAPAVKLSLVDTQLKLRDVQWPLAQPVPFEASAQLKPPQGKPAGIAVSGQGTDAAGSATLKLSDLALSVAAPYLSAYLVPQAAGVLEGVMSASWKDGAVQLQAKHLALHDFALTPPTGKTDVTAKELPVFKLLEVSDVTADLQQHTLAIGKLALRSPKLRVQRGEDGQWMVAHWLKPMPATAPGASSAPVTPWAVSLADVALDDGTLVWADRLPAKPVFLELSALQSHAKALSLDGKRPVPLSLSAKVRSARTDPGSLRFDGSVMWDPVLAQGALEVTQFPAQALAPYLTSRLRLDVLRADTSFKGQLRYAALAAGAQVQVRGDAAVEELQVNSLAAPAPAGATGAGSTASEELLNWKALSVPGIDFSMTPGAPMRLTLREISLSDFFARLIVNPLGRLVLQDLVNPQDGVAAPGAPVAATAPATANGSAADDPVIDIGAIRLVNGRVAFSDRFIKPNYSANLTGLSGSLSHFSSQNPQGGVQMADLDLHGRAEGTASLAISGKLNPLAKPLALDVNATVRDLELSPLSSYAIKYAGYGIERGRLSVDLHYTVSPDGQLQASNQIVLNQLVFGEAAQGAGSSLPVKLAVALLADSNGVIDLNVPLSGSLNDPQFRVWPIVWKVIGNIITKALTSPFSLISGALSGSGAADELSSIAFETGTATIQVAGLPGLDKVAQALRDKPALRLTVVGTANLEREADAMRRERLKALMLAEKRRTAASAGKDVTAVVEVMPDEAPALLKEVYRRSGIKKPRNVVGFAKDLPDAEIEALLLDNIAVDEDAVRELALNRSMVVRDYLTARQLPADRLYLGSVRTGPVDAQWKPGAELNIEHH